MLVELVADNFSDNGSDSHSDSEDSIVRKTKTVRSLPDYNESDNYNDILMIFKLWGDRMIKTLISSCDPCIKAHILLGKCKELISLTLITLILKGIYRVSLE